MNSPLSDVPVAFSLLQYLGAVPVCSNGGHCLFTLLLIFQLSEEFAGLVDIKHDSILMLVSCLHGFLVHVILGRVMEKQEAHLPSSGVGLHHSGGALDLLVFLLLL